MRASTPSARRRRYVACALGAIVIVAGCVAQSTPSVRGPGQGDSPSPLGSPSPTPPIPCDDGPTAHTPMPADCVVPTEEILPTFYLPPLDTQPPKTDSPGLPPGLATLPPATAWHGKTIYAPPAGSASRLIGLGPDDTIYVLLERPLPLPDPTPTSALVVPDVDASVIALRPDGSVRPGWPSAGVHVAGFPVSYKVNDAGTVFVAGGANPFGGDSSTQSQLTITAIGPDGKVVSGWPYRTPAALQPLEPNLLVPGPDGTVCFLQEKPGVPTGSDAPMMVYCLGGDGKVLPGWPYSSQSSLGSPAVGPDGTVYVTHVTSTKTTTNPYTYPYEVLAIGLDGKPKSGWTAWSKDGADGITAIMPTEDGRVYLLLGGDDGPAELIVLDLAGNTLRDHVELASTLRYPTYKDAVLTNGGSLFVAVDGGDADVVNAYSPNGSQMAGWPQLIGGWGDIAVGADGSVWVAWTVYGATTTTPETSVVALFDKNGKLQPGYPMKSSFLVSYHGSYGLAVASDGTAYDSAANGIVSFAR